MKVRMRTTVAGEDSRGKVYTHDEGEIVDLPNGLAKEYLTAPEGSPRAEPVVEKPADARRETRKAGLAPTRSRIVPRR
jgi:hypothetical protein